MKESTVGLLCVTWLAAIATQASAQQSKPCPPEREWTCRDPSALAAWRQLHAEWSARSTSSVHIVSARTGHYVMNDQPTLIVNAVRFVLDHVRATVH